MADEVMRESGTADARGTGIGPVVAGAVLVLLAAWRARYGVSLFDSSHYTVVAMRIAQGARPFADEMTLQATGFLLPAVFAKAWLAIFGRGAIELALRLFFVALAAGAGVVVFRALRPSFGAWPAFVAAAVPLLAPPYNILAFSYNTGAVLGGVTGAALAFAAVRDDDRLAAAGAGAALAFAAVSYPPLVVAAFAGLAAFLVAARGRHGLALWMTAGGLGVAAVVAAWLYATGSLAGIRDTMAYSTASAGGGLQTIGDRVRLFLPFVTSPLTRTNAWPAWGLALVAAVPVVPARLRAAALGLLPLAVALPALRHVSADQAYIGVIGASMLITFTTMALVPLAVWLAAERRGDLGRLMLIAAPLGLVGGALVLYSTNAGWNRGTAIAGLAPLVMAVLAAWAVFVREKGGRAILAASAVGLVAVALVMLYATAFKDDVPRKLTASLPGAYAGLLTTPERAEDFAGIAEAGGRVIDAHDTVTVFHAPGVYLLVPGRISANATWMYQGSSSGLAMEYFRAHGGLPDVVVAHKTSRRRKPGTSDPLLDELAKSYRLGAESRTFDFYVKR